MKSFHIDIPGSKKATLDGYILDCELSLGQFTERPAILVCPGGGYVYCCAREGEPVAMSYAARGFHTFVLNYSTGFDAAGFAPLKEVSWAIGYIREHAAQWHVDPNKIVSCGFSAGGYLAMSAGILAENKANAMILGYPAASAPNIPGADFMLRLLTGKQNPTDEDAAQFDLVSHITKDAPPVFLVATAEDMLTNFGTLPIVNKYAALQLPYEVHIFGHGPHGYSLAEETAADGSSQGLNPAFAQWQNLSVHWLYKIFGALEFTDKNNSQMAKHLKAMGISMPGA